MIISRSVFSVVLPGLVALTVAAGPGEPLCCPTRKVRNTYNLRDGKLLLASSEVQGTLSLADVKGVTWRFSRLGPNERVPEGVKVKAVFGDGRVSGSGGCNRYNDDFRIRPGNRHSCRRGFFTINR